MSKQCVQQCAYMHWLCCPLAGLNMLRQQYRIQEHNSDATSKTCRLGKLGWYNVKDSFCSIPLLSLFATKDQSIMMVKAQTIDEQQRMLHYPFDAHIVASWKEGKKKAHRIGGKCLPPCVCLCVFYHTFSRACHAKNIQHKLYSETIT